MKIAGILESKDWYIIDIYFDTEFSRTLHSEHSFKVGMQQMENEL